MLHRGVAGATSNSSVSGPSPLTNRKWDVRFALAVPTDRGGPEMWLRRLAACAALSSLGGPKREPTITPVA